MPCSLSLPQQIEQSVIKEKLLFAGFRKISSEVQKKRSNAEGVLTGSGGRSDDISCRKKDVSCRRPHKARESWYTKFVNL